MSISQLVSEKPISFDESHVFLRKPKRSYSKIVRGSGIYLYDINGNKYLDAVGGAFVASLGHGRCDVVNRISEQLKSVAYVNGLQFTTDATETLAKMLTDRGKHLGFSRASFLCSGSEALEASIKFARQCALAQKQEKRTKLIARAPSYHGNTFFGLSVSARESYRASFLPFITDVLRASTPDERRGSSRNYLTQFENIVRDNDPESILAFVVEPVSGSSQGGMVPPEGYFEGIQEICTRYGIRIIADEVLCGVGRTGKFFASDQVGLRPDVLILGKGLSAGFAPLSAVLMKEDDARSIIQNQGGFQHAQTYMQAPCMTAAGVATLEIIDQENLVQNASKMGIFFHEELSKVLADHPYFGGLSGIGLLAGVEWVYERDSLKPFPMEAKVAEKFSEYCLDHGLVLWANQGHIDGKQGDFVLMAPPLSVMKEDIHIIVQKFSELARSFPWIN